MNKQVVGGYLVRWLSLMHEFDITIMDKLGKENVVADFLSNLHIKAKEQIVDNSFLHEHLFSLTIHVINEDCTLVKLDSTILCNMETLSSCGWLMMRMNL